MIEVDRLTSALIDTLRESTHHGRFIDAVDAVDVDPSSSPLREARILLVPGILYREYPNTGADGEVIRRIVSTSDFDLEIFEAEEIGRLATNVSGLLQWLRDRAPHPNPTLLVSLSKGSTEVWRALHSPTAVEAFRHVDAWISVSGIPLGTPSLDHLVRAKLRHAFVRAVFRWKGWDAGFLHDYGYDNSARVQVAEGPALEELLHRLLVVHVSGFPRAADLSDRRSRRLHRRLARRGPNDGFAYLDDLCELPGHVYPVEGSDHYLRQADDVDGLVRRILSATLSFMARDGIDVADVTER